MFASDINCHQHCFYFILAFFFFFDSFTNTTKSDNVVDDYRGSCRKMQHCKTKPSHFPIAFFRSVYVRQTHNRRSILLDITYNRGDTMPLLKILYLSIF